MRKTIVRKEVLKSNYIAIADDKGIKVTYKELAETAEENSQYIEERSIIFVLCDRQIETAGFIYELLYLNRVPLLLPDDIDVDLFDNLVSIYRPQYIYCNKENASINQTDPVIVLENHILYKTSYGRPRMHPDVALLLSTSGTTGSAKLVKLSYDNLYNNAEYACRHLDIRGGQKGISPLPINYTYGIAFCFWHWHCGATILITDENIIGNKFRDFYVKERANNFAATPFAFQMLERVRFWDSKKISYLHFAMSGGAQMSDEDQVNLVQTMNDKFWIGYGQTECTCIISGMNFDVENIKLGSIGRAFSNMEVILDENTSELCIRSKSVCMGYAVECAQLADGDVNHGILHTGDVAHIDDEGYIYLKGRLTRYVKILGKRVNLDDIEKYLKNWFSDVEFACVGTDDSISIFYSDSIDDISAGISSILDKNLKIPRKFVECFQLKTIPRNDAGKIMYAKLHGMGREK